MGADSTSQAAICTSWFRAFLELAEVEDPAWPEIQQWFAEVSAGLRWSRLTTL